MTTARRQTVIRIALALLACGERQELRADPQAATIHDRAQDDATGRLREARQQG